MAELHSPATELIHAVGAIDAVERLSALTEGLSNPDQMRGVRGALVGKALRAAVTAALSSSTPRRSPKVQAAVEDPQPYAPPITVDLRSLRAARDDWERQWLTVRLSQNGGIVASLAREIDMNRAALCRKLDQLGVAKRPRRTKKETA